MTHDTEVLKALLAKVEAATGPDRELDKAIMRALYIEDERFIGEEADDGPNGEWVRCKTPVFVDPRTDKWVCTHAFRFTEEARDADRLLSFLPGDGWRLSTMTPDPTDRRQHSGAWAKVQPFAANLTGWDVGARDCTAPTVPLAVTVAALMVMVSAALAQGGHHEA